MKRAPETLVDIFDHSTQQHAERPLFGTKRAEGWEWTSYAQFRELCERCRGGLAKLGVGPGDRVAIVSNNRVEWAVAAYAAYSLGAGFVPMYENQNPEEWRFIVRDCGARVVFAATPEVCGLLSRLSTELTTLEHVVGFHLELEAPGSFAGLLRAGADHPTAPHQPQPRDVAAILYTSGTTGTPKGVVLTHANICANILAVRDLFDVGPQDRSLSFLPWTHAFGQTAELHFLFSVGCAIAINDDIQNLLANLGTIQPTLLLAVPRIFNRIYDRVHNQISGRPAPIRKLFHAAIEASKRVNEGHPVSLLQGMALAVANRAIFAKIRRRFGGKLRFAISGSAALSREVAEFVDALGIEVYEGYGLTETAPVVAVNHPAQRKVGSVGKPLPGVNVSIDRTACEDEPHGEIIVHGPNVMRGYYGRPEETREVLLPDAGFRTGDLGFLDDEGFLHITGRLKEQYKLSNGKYVAPAPLEEQLRLSPFIANVMLYGDNKPFNVALVVPDKDAVRLWAKQHGRQIDDLRTPEVIALLQEQIEKRAAGFRKYEVPRKLVIADEDFCTDNDLLTPSLKLKRRNVLALYRSRLDQLYEGTI